MVTKYQIVYYVICVLFPEQIHYDDTFKYDTSNPRQYIDKMMTHLQSHFCLNSLGTNIQIEVLEYYIKQIWWFLSVVFAVYFLATLRSTFNSAIFWICSALHYSFFSFFILRQITIQKPSEVNLNTFRPPISPTLFSIFIGYWWLWAS